MSSATLFAAMQMAVERYCALAPTTAQVERVEDLTDDQKIGLCWLAQCEMVHEVKDNKIVFKTKNPVGFVRENGQWLVYEKVGSEPEPEPVDLSRTSGHGIALW